MKIVNKIKNAIGIMIVRYIIHTGTQGWIITRKSGTQQVIKVYSKQAYENVVRPAVEKQKPVKLIMEEDESWHSTVYVCPTCGAKYGGRATISDYCYHCGQKLDWSDPDDKLD